MGEKIKSFRELKVYKASFKLQQKVFVLTGKFPKEELYSLVDQVMRSSRSIGSNLTEAWAKRRYFAHFVSKLTDADGEQLETQHWMDTAYACKYISKDEHLEMISQCEEIGGMLGKMMKEPEKWRARYTQVRNR